MKIRFTFLWFLCCIWCVKDVQGQTNVYHPFVHDGAEWSVLYERYFNEGQYFDYRTIYKTIAVGDTTVSGKEYFVTITYKVDAPEYIDTFYLREDTVLKKVFVNHDSRTNGIDSLLYDFAIDSGESISNTYSFALYPDAKITSIDSILIGGNYRNKFNIEYTTIYTADPWLWEDTLIKTYWIEGIGSENGLIANQGKNQFLPPNAYTLLCYNEYGIDLYTQVSEFADCDSTFFHYGVNNINNGNAIFEVYPNPASDFVTISLNNKINLNACLFEIHSVEGNRIHSQTLKSNNSLVDISKLPTGIYFISIKENTAPPLTKKLIVY